MMDRGDLMTLEHLLSLTGKGLCSIQAVLDSADAERNHDYDEEWSRNVVAVCSLAMNGLIPVFQGARAMVEKQGKAARQKDAQK